MLGDNILLLTDSYKVSHWRQYPPDTTRVFSFLESRGGQYGSTVFFGLSYLIQRYLAGPVVTQERIEEAASFFKAHFGDETLFNRDGWEYILKAHGGHLPVRIRAVPEGTVVPTKNVLMTIENTDPSVPWLVNYLETLLVQVWYPTTVATQSRVMKLRLRDAMVATGADLAGLPFKLHDFGYRGSTSVESAGIGGAAHLVNFMGTDTMAALEVARKYYDEPMAGYSIPAAEHSTMTSWGREREADAYANMLEQYPTGLVAVVSDSYDIYNAVRNIWGGSLRDRVLQRDGVVIIRPDSGDPATVVLDLLRILWEKFGGTSNADGFRVLNPKVRLIQGDGIDIDTMFEVLSRMVTHGWSIDNIAFGSGGGLLQKVNRDTCRFAMKCSAVSVGGVWRDVMKSPIGDVTKKSKSGRLILTRDHSGAFVTTVEGFGRNVLDTMFLDGQQYSKPAFAMIRERAAI